MSAANEMIGPRYVDLGRCRVTPLLDASASVPLVDCFPSVDRQAWESATRNPWAHPLRSDLHRFEYGGYLIEVDGRCVLVDTGVGPSTAPWPRANAAAGRLLDELDSLGLAPADIGVVVLTHLHPDHIGWNVTDVGGEMTLTFSKAEYIVHEADWLAFQNPAIEERFGYPFRAAQIQPLAQLGGLRLISSEVAVAPDVVVRPTPGHTPGSVSVLVQRGEGLVLWGDVTVHPAQVTHPEWEFAFDDDHVTARETRLRMIDLAFRDASLVGAGHYLGFGRIRQSHDARWLEAIDSDGKETRDRGSCG